MKGCGSVCNSVILFFFFCKQSASVAQTVRVDCKMFPTSKMIIIYIIRDFVFFSEVKGVDIILIIFHPNKEVNTRF